VTSADDTRVTYVSVPPGPRYVYIIFFFFAAVPRLTRAHAPALTHGCCPPLLRAHECLSRDHYRYYCRATIYRIYVSVASDARRRRRRRRLRERSPETPSGWSSRPRFSYRIDGRRGSNRTAWVSLYVFPVCAPCLRSRERRRQTVRVELNSPPGDYRRNKIMSARALL